MPRIWAGVLSLQLMAGVAKAQTPPVARPPVAVPQQATSERRDEPRPWRRRPFSVAAVGGIATPWGLLGLSAELVPLEHVSIGGGVGTNLLGWQLAAMARARFTPQHRFTFYLGAGYSQGRHDQFEGNRDGVFSLLTGPLSSMGHTSDRGHEWKTARWLNLELGFERRENRLELRGFVGTALLLNPGAGVVDSPDDTESAVFAVRHVLVYAGLALGSAL